MAWLLLVLFIGIGCLFAISSYADAPKSPNTIPIPEDTASQKSFDSGAVGFDNTPSTSDLDQVPEIKIIGEYHSDGMGSVFDDSNSFDSLNNLSGLGD